MIQPLLKLLPYVRPYRWYILGSVLLAIPLSAIRVGPVYFVQLMLNDVLTRHSISRLLFFSLALIGFYGFNFIIRFAHAYFLRIVIIRVNQKLKNDIFNHLLGLSADYFTTQSTGTLISRTSVDPQSVDAGLACIGILIREPITLIFLFGYALFVNWRLTCISFLLAPVLVWLFSVTGRNLKRYSLGMAEVSARLYSTLQESYSGIRIVKLFLLEHHLEKKFKERNEHYAKLLLKTSMLEEISHPLVELLTALILAPLIYYGGLQVLLNKMSSGELFGFFTAFALMINPIRVMNDVNIKLYQASAACTRIFEMFEWKSNIQECTHPQVLTEIQQGIEVQNVSFAYPDAPERPVLKNIQFSLKRGQVMAIVGESGAGKSSFISLLPRIFDVTEGSIQIDGCDIRKMALQDLRKMIAVVSQDVFLFNDTIEENIRCGQATATFAQIREAAANAYALPFIEPMPQQFQTMIGDRGQKLSGGEKQRLSIARAFLRQAPLLILDEATSSLDTASERAVQEALEKLMIHRTTLVIAHRLSTVRHADLILVLKQGEVIETGTHAELIQRNGEYARFHGAGVPSQ